MGGRNYLGEIDTNQQFDDSLENIEPNKGNLSINTTFTKNNHAKSVFYEIPNTPVSVKRKSRIHQNAKIRDEIRKSLNNTVTLRKTIEQQRERLREQKNRDSNATYIMEEKKPKKREKICDMIYLKTIDNLLNTVRSELDFGKINSRFADDHKYIEIFSDNISKLKTHLDAKLKFNAGLKLFRCLRNRVAIRKAKQVLNELKIKRNAAITIQKHWRRRQAQKAFTKLLSENSEKLAIARIERKIRQAEEQKKIELSQKRSATIIQRSWRRHLLLKRLNDRINLRREQNCLLVLNQCARIIQKCWRHYQFRKTIALLIEKKQQAMHRRWLNNQSALVIQRNWKVYLLKVNLIKLVEQRRNKIAIIRNESAKLIQRNWRIYLFNKSINQLIQQRKQQIDQQILLENLSASLIQRNWRSYRLKAILNDRMIEKRNRKEVASRTIQRAWKVYKMYKQRRIDLEHWSAMIIQTNWRMYRAQKRFKQLKFEIYQLKRAASILQRSWRSHVVRKNLANRIELNKLRKANEAATVIQRAWKSYRSRKQQLNEKKQKLAAIKIQKTWRGYALRKKFKRDNKRVSGILERISEVNNRANTQTTVGEKTKIAIQKLSHYKYYGTALHILQELERTTNLSDESCLQMANFSIIEILHSTIRTCNRSEPCLQIIKLSLSIILNIAKNEKALPLLTSVPSLKESIIEIMSKHHKKTSIFLKGMTILYIFLQFENFPDTPAMSIKIRRLLNKIETSNQFSALKQKTNKIYRFDARWKAKKTIRTQFYTTKQAIDAFSQIYG